MDHGLRWLFAELFTQPAIRFKSATRDISFLRSDFEVLAIRERPVQRYSEVFGLGQMGRILLLKLTFSSHLVSLLLSWKTTYTVFVVLSFSFQV